MTGHQDREGIERGVVAPKVPPLRPEWSGGIRYNDKGRKR